MVSYDAAAEIDRLYARFESITYDLNYSAHVKQLGTERIFFSPSLRRPRVESPAYDMSTELVDARRLAS